MSLFRRASRMVRARATTAVERMERPDLMIAEAVRDAERDRNAVYGALHKSMQGMIMTRKQAHEQRTKASRLRDRAESQFEQDRTDLAEQSMRSALLHEYTADALESTIYEMESQNSGLTEALAQLDSALEVIKAMAIVEESRYRQAAGSQAAAEARYGGPDGSPSAFAELERARKKAMSIAASAEATLAIGSGRINNSDSEMPDFAHQAKRELGIPTAGELAAASAGELSAADEIPDMIVDEVSEPAPVERD